MEPAAGTGEVQQQRGRSLSAAREAWAGEVRRPFGVRVVDAVAGTGPLCAGIDPSPDLLSAWGMADTPEGLRRFGEHCLDAFAGAVPVVKPQVAWFERHGSAGLAALEELLEAARAAGLLVIADAKRGDVDVTSAAYADAWLGEGRPLAADAVTASAYLGLGALSPMVEMARRTGRGVIVVARSSNPEGQSLQQAGTAGGLDVGDAMLAGIAELNTEELNTDELDLDEGRAGAGGRGEGFVGSVGAVVGATRGPSGFDLTTLGGVLLAPGVGAQGAGPAEVAALFAGCPAVLPNVSRSLLRAGPEVGALRDAALRTRDDMARAGL